MSDNRVNKALLRSFIPVLLFASGCAHKALVERVEESDGGLVMVLAVLAGEREEPKQACGPRSKLDLPAAQLASPVLATDSVTLKRSGCFGRCPVYSVTVHGDGRVTAQGERHVALEGPQEWAIQPVLAQRVLGEFVRVNVFTRKATMIGHISDLPTARLQVRVSKREVKIEHYGAGSELQWGFGGADNQLLTELERLVEQASEAETRVVGCIP